MVLMDIDIILFKRDIYVNFSIDNKTIIASFVWVNTWFYQPDKSDNRPSDCILGQYLFYRIDKPHIDLTTFRQ